jgi:transcriptional regulator with XRE-family HTH domain
MNEIGELLKALRRNDSLRTAAAKTGLSYNYIRIVERGLDDRGLIIKPSPETLRMYANGYGYSFQELMRIAGYSETLEEEIEFDPSTYRIAKLIQKLSYEKKDLIESVVKALLE